MNTNIITLTYNKAFSIVKNAFQNGNTELYNVVISMLDTERVTYTISLLDEQVNNGGFHQYLTNSTGQLAYLTLTSLKIVGLDDIHKLLECAIQIANPLNLADDIFRKESSKLSLNALDMNNDKALNKLQHLDFIYGERIKKKPYEIAEKIINYLEANLQN